MCVRGGGGGGGCGVGGTDTLGVSRAFLQLVEQMVQN